MKYSHLGKRGSMKYVEFDIKNPYCVHCFISDRAYASVIADVLQYNAVETGGVFLGYISNKCWYIMEAIDCGLDTINEAAFFRWDSEYVNHQVERLERIYKRHISILGFWHRHPGDYDVFSEMDHKTIRQYSRQLNFGLISMLVNVDPALRMTFYHCINDNIMKVNYDVGDKLIPIDFFKYSQKQDFIDKEYMHGKKFDIIYNPVITYEKLVESIKKKQYKKDSENKAIEPKTDETAQSKETDTKADETAQSKKTDTKTDETAQSKKTDTKADETAQSKKTDTKTDETAQSKETDTKADETAQSKETDTKADETAQNKETNAKADETAQNKETDTKADETAQSKETDTKADETAENEDSIEKDVKKNKILKRFIKKLLSWFKRKNKCE